MCVCKDKPIVYASKMLNDTKKNSSIVENEKLSHSLYHYRKTFKVLSNHRSLRWLFSVKNPNSKLVIWRPTNKF